jgi:hypothetical protein
VIATAAIASATLGRTLIVLLMHLRLGLLQFINKVPL